jgi:hypothetical protein
MNALAVKRVHEYAPAELEAFFARFGLRVQWVEQGQIIPGSYWGDDEAGLIADSLYLRPDTPVHSALHEACHWIVMDPEKREHLHTDASDSIVEENACCYLQILLADQLVGFGQERAWADMDAWGYSFRLGSARRWFEHDAADAIEFLLRHGLIDEAREPRLLIRTTR